jgi:hypothetical protein
LPSSFDEEHVAGDEFTLWIPAALTDLTAIGPHQVS